MEEIDIDEPPIASMKDWLQQTNQSLSKLKSIKKTPYHLGGGPREREVNCQCNYRSKTKSSFLSLEADPPQLSQDSQETASNSDISVPELLKYYHDKKAQKAKPKRRPYSATVCSTRDAAKHKEKQQEERRDSNYNTFIAVKGSTVSPKPRPSSGSISGSTDDNKLYKGAYMLHLDPQHVEEVQRATMEGMRKYSAYGQSEESSSPVPPPPRASPEPPPHSPLDDVIDDDDDDADLFSDDDDDDSNDSFDRTHPPSVMKPLVFEIPTADLDCDSGDEESHRAQPLIPQLSTDNSAESERALSADYVTKSETYLDELTQKQTQESQKLSAMYAEMEFAQNRVDDIDLRSIISSPITAGRRTVSPVGAGYLTPGDPSGLSVVNIGMGSETFDVPPEGSNYEGLWVEELYRPRIQSAGIRRDFHVSPERFHRPARRVQSAKTNRNVVENEFVLKGKNFELLDSQNLAVTGRLSGSPARRSSDSGSHSRKSAESSPMGSRTANSAKPMENRRPTAPEKVVGKPPRPKSSKKKTLKQKGDSPIASSSDEPTISPHPPLTRKSSLRKSYSQEDVRCLSPEVISSVKKTVSFSDSVLDQRTLGIKRTVTSKDDQQSVNPDPQMTEKQPQNEQKQPNEQEQDALNKVPNVGVIIQNGLEVREPPREAPQSTSDLGPPSKAKVKNESGTSSLIAKVKEATRCSCHEEDCHCRDIIRPTMAVLCQAKAVRERAEQDGKASTKEKLLKQRPSRPSSAPIRRGVAERPHSPPSPSRSRLTSAQHKRSGSEGSRKPRPVSAHIKRPSGKDAIRTRSAMFKERTPQPPGSKTKKPKAKPDVSLQDIGFVWGAGEDTVAASEECEDVYNKLKEKGINVSMETIKRGLMAPARRASETCMTSLASSSSSGLLSRPEKWLPEEYARVKIWDKALKKR